VKDIDEPFVEIIHFLSTGVAPQGYTMQQMKELGVMVAIFSVIVGNLYKMGPDEVRN